jgi:hypothetical protein
MMRDAQRETFNLNRALSDGSIAFRLLRLALVVGPLGRKPINSHACSLDITIGRFYFSLLLLFSIFPHIQKRQYTICAFTAFCNKK